MNYIIKKMKFVIVLIILFMCFYNFTSKFKIQATPLSHIYFCVDGDVAGVPEFKFYFDKEKKVIKVIDRKKDNFLCEQFKDKEAFRIESYDEWGVGKMSRNLLGGEKGDSPTLDYLDNYRFSYGDTFYFYHIDYKKLRIEGNLQGFKGFDPKLGSIGFTPSKDGFSIVYVEPPIFHGISDIKIKLGSEFDSLEGVSAISTLEGDLTGFITVDGDVDVDKAGEYILTYYVGDSYNNKVMVERKVIVEDDPINIQNHNSSINKDDIKKNKIDNPKNCDRDKMKNVEGIYTELKIVNQKNYFRSINRKINKFIIKMNS